MHAYLMSDVMVKIYKDIKIVHILANKTKGGPK